MSAAAMADKDKVVVIIRRRWKREDEIEKL